MIGDERKRERKSRQEEASVAAVGLFDAEGKKCEEVGRAMRKRGSMMRLRLGVRSVGDGEPEMARARGSGQAALEAQSEVA